LHEEISRRAYELFQSKGNCRGDGIADWLKKSYCIVLAGQSGRSATQKQCEFTIPITVSFQPAKEFSMHRPARFTASILFLLLTTVPVLAQSPQQFADDATRYMALGDSIAAGYKAMPVTNGYTFLLYQGAVFDTIPHTLFNAAAVPGATSADVLHYQAPQAVMPFAIGGFNPKYITLTVGGNDLLAILAFVEANPGATEQQIFAFAQQQLTAYAANLQAILAALRTGLPDAKIFVSNQYDFPEIQAVLPFTDAIVAAFNNVVLQVTSAFPLNVYLVDVHAAFLGRNNLIEGERAQVSIFEVHPTNVGHRVIAQAFANVIAANR
jgi:lysophospholipase L1-like esterase